MSSPLLIRAPIRAARCEAISLKSPSAGWLWRDVRATLSTGINKFSTIANGWNARIFICSNWAGNDSFSCRWAARRESYWFEQIPELQVAV